MVQALQEIGDIQAKCSEDDKLRLKQIQNLLDDAGERVSDFATVADGSSQVKQDPSRYRDRAVHAADAAKQALNLAQQAGGIMDTVDGGPGEDKSFGQIASDIAAAVDALSNASDSFTSGL